MPQAWLSATRGCAAVSHLRGLAAANYTTRASSSGWPDPGSLRPERPDTSDDLDTFNQVCFRHTVDAAEALGSLSTSPIKGLQAQELDDLFGVAHSREEHIVPASLQPTSRVARQTDNAPGTSPSQLASKLTSSSPDASSRLSHLDHRGSAQMVDVGQKEVTRRTATARMHIHLSQEVFREVMNPKHLKKGNVIETARIAGIMAAKHTPSLIPMCHSVPLDKVQVEIEPREQNASQTELEITATASATHRTGVEMEALTAAAVAGLTVYDMCKAMDHGIILDGLKLVHKAGGKTGTWTRSNG